MGHTFQRGIKGCIAQLKEIQNLQSGKLLLVESGIQHILLWNLESWTLESQIQVKASGIPFKNWNLESKFHWQRIQNQVPGTWNPRESWNQESKNHRRIGPGSMPGPHSFCSAKEFFFFLRCPSINSRHTKRAAPIPSLQCLVVYPARGHWLVKWK